MQGGDASTQDLGAHGRCVVVTPERDGVPEPMPHALADALAHHGATIEHALSPYHAITRIARPNEASRVTLMLVQPTRHPRADTLALAAMTHAPDVAVWRFDPAHESPVAPYVPEKPGVVPDPLFPDPGGDEDAPDDDGPEDSTPPAPADGPASLRIVGEGDTPEPPADDNQPLVTSEELSMLLGQDDEDDHR